MSAMTKTATPIKLSFTDLTYTVRVKSSRSERKSCANKYLNENILKSVSGYALPG